MPQVRACLWKFHQFWGSSRAPLPAWSARAASEVVLVTVTPRTVPLRRHARHPVQQRLDRLAVGQPLLWLRGATCPNVLCLCRDAILSSNTSTISLDLVSAKTNAAGGWTGQAGVQRASGGVQLDMVGASSAAGRSGQQWPALLLASRALTLLAQQHSACHACPAACPCADTHALLLRRPHPGCPLLQPSPRDAPAGDCAHRTHQQAGEQLGGCAPADLCASVAAWIARSLAVLAETCTRHCMHPAHPQPDPAAPTLAPSYFSAGHSRHARVQQPHPQDARGGGQLHRLCSQPRLLPIHPGTGVGLGRLPCCCWAYAAGPSSLSHCFRIA